MSSHKEENYKRGRSKQACLHVWRLTSRLRTGSQQVDDIQMMSNMNENFQLWHQGTVLTGCGSLCNAEIRLTVCVWKFKLCVHMSVACVWVESEGGQILTLKHLDCNSGACSGFLDAKGGCFYHLTERSSSQWVTFSAKHLSRLNHHQHPFNNLIPHM